MMEASEYASGHDHLGTASYLLETSQFNKILKVGTPKGSDQMKKAQKS